MIYPPMIGAAQLREKVRFEDLLEPVSLAFQQSSAGQAHNGLVVMFPGERPEDGDVYVKTGVLQGRPVHVVKVSPWFAHNVQAGQPQGGFLAVFDSQTGHTLGLLHEEHYLSDIRTAAAGGLAARVLAPPTVHTAAVLGAGVQAYWQPQALYRERPFQVLRVWARNPDRASTLVHRLSSVLPEVSIQVSTHLEDTVRSADVLITATVSREPLVQPDWLHPGQHITAVGADDATKCELAPGVLQKARVFVDALDTAAANGDVHHAIQGGTYTLGQVAGELGEVLSGRKPGRLSAEDITVAKLVGLGVQDLVAAEVSLQKLGLLAVPG